MHVVELNVPEPLELKLTVPPGIIAVPGDVSVTVAVHVVGPFNMSGLGAQLTLVEVVRCVTVKAKLPEPLLELPK